MHRSTKRFLTTLLLLSSSVCSWAGHPSRGLWVGEVALNSVNEATGAVGDSNTYEFSDPNTVTPTSDTAFLRLLLHVNGAGQAELLKSVALYVESTDAAGNSDLILITDPSLYSNYPGLARRFASASYDFGDQQAVEAVEQLIDLAVATAVEDVFASVDEAVTVDKLSDPTNQDGLLDLIVANADVETAYLDRGDGAFSFITNEFFTLAQVFLLADAVAAEIDGGAQASDFEYSYNPSISYQPFTPIPPVGSDFDLVVASAEDLVTASFYGDTRGIDAIVNILLSAADASVGADLSEKKANARLAAEAAWHNASDLTQLYNRFLATAAYASLPDVIPSIAALEAITEEADGGTEAEIEAAVEAALLVAPGIQAAYTQAAVVFAESLNDDPRAQRVLDHIISAAVHAAATQVLVDTDPSLLEDTIANAVEAAYSSVDSAPVLPSGPTELYTDFVRSEDYAEAAFTAAQKAASEANFQYKNGLDDASKDKPDMTVIVTTAVEKALVAIRNESAALPLYSVQLDGSLAAGSSLTGEFYLAALAPTNPFLHRLHPDHTKGFPITRRISISVDEIVGGSDFIQSGYGVKQLKGSYTEEIFGLHKPLGPNQDIGLKTSGSFSLNRLTLVDTLNF